MNVKHNCKKLVNDEIAVQKRRKKNAVYLYYTFSHYFYRHE